MYDDLAVIAAPGAVKRRPETEGTETALAGLGYRIVHIEAPGVLEGGDVLKHGGTVYVGQGGRTNAEGIRQLTGHLKLFGSTVIAVPVTKALHLKSTVTALRDGTIIGFPGVGRRPLVLPKIHRRA